MNLVLSTSPHCHLSTYEISSQYLEQTWIYAVENLHQKGNNSANGPERLQTLHSAIFLIVIYLSMKFQHNIMQGYGDMLCK